MQKAVEGFEAWSASGGTHLIMDGIEVCDEILAEISVSILPKKENSKCYSPGLYSYFSTVPLHHVPVYNQEYLWYSGRYGS